MILDKKTVELCKKLQKKIETYCRIYENLKEITPLFHGSICKISDKKLKKYLIENNLDKIYIIFNRILINKEYFDNENNDFLEYIYDISTEEKIDIFINMLDQKKEVKKINNCDSNLQKIMDLIEEKLDSNDYERLKTYFLDYKNVSINEIVEFFKMLSNYTKKSTKKELPKTDISKLLLISNSKYQNKIKKLL